MLCTEYHHRVRPITHLARAKILVAYTWEVAGVVVVVEEEEEEERKTQAGFTLEEVHIRWYTEVVVMDKEEYMYGVRRNRRPYKLYVRKRRRFIHSESFISQSMD